MAEEAHEEKSLREIPASKILAEIERGIDVRYAGVVVKGSLDVRNIGLPMKDGKSLVASRIEIIDSIIDGRVSFSEAIIKEPINFLGTTFNQYVYFMDTTFKGEVSFQNANFDGFSSFSGSMFGEEAFFYNAIFSDDADFNGATFDEYAFFGRTTFNGYAHFRGATFGRYVDFSSAILNKEASFLSATFNMIAFFIDAIFKDDVNFTHSKFNTKARFESTSFNKSLKLNDTQIYYMNLRAKFNEGSYISLRYSDFHKIEIYWKDIKDKFEYDGSAYLALIKNYNNLEWFDDADECYYQYRTIRRKEHLQGLKWAVLLHYGLVVPRNHYPLATIFVSTTLYATEPS